MFFDEEQLTEYGKELGSRLGSGAVVALVGELGVGKTTLAKAIADGLGVTETVTSPTFTLICEYRSGRLPLYHMDFYRLDASELAETGCDEYIFGTGVAIIEWASRADGFLPNNTLRIELNYTDDPNIREVIVNAGD